MTKLTNPTVAHADAVIRLAGRLLNQSQQLLGEISEIGNSSEQTTYQRAADLKEKVQFHVTVLREMLKQEHAMVNTETRRVTASQTGAATKQALLRSLNEKTQILSELSYLTEQQRGVSLTPLSFFSRPSLNPAAEQFNPTLEEFAFYKK